MAFWQAEQALNMPDLTIYNKYGIMASWKEVYFDTRVSGAI